MNPSRVCTARVYRLQRLRNQLVSPTPTVSGKLSRMIGLTMEATGCSASIGSKCHVSTHTGFVDAKVVGFSEDKLFLMPFDEIQGLTVGAQVLPVNQKFDASVGDGLLGRIIDAAGEPIDELGPISGMARRSIQAEPINPLQRTLINQPLDVGVRAINGLLTVGRGQRMGLIAGSGVGKSQLLGMMSRHTEADVTVIGMIGERGREVKAFVDNILGSEGLANSVVVAVPADNTAVRRLHGAMLATTIAEHFRDQGKHVLLLMDSLTRFAQAQREIGLAIGEPPTTKGYPPSVFKLLPQLVERAGYGASGGSVTAIYTLLAEGDDQNDPVVDAARAVLDGHIVLSREVAESGVYPAIDLEASVSRLANDLADQQQLKAIGALRRLYGLYKQNENLINMGVYQAGSNSDVDQAIRAWPNIQSYIRQALSESSNRTESINSLLEIIHSLDAVATV